MCEEEELHTVLDTIAKSKGALLAKWISQHPEYQTPPAEAEEVPPRNKISEEAMAELKELVMDLIRNKTDGELGASLVDVIADLCALYDREDVDEGIEQLLNSADIYEPFVGKIALVRI